MKERIRCRLTKRDGFGRSTGRHEMTFNDTRMFYVDIDSSYCYFHIFDKTGRSFGWVYIPQLHALGTEAVDINIQVIGTKSLTEFLEEAPYEIY